MTTFVFWYEVTYFVGPQISVEVFPVFVFEVGGCDLCQCRTKTSSTSNVGATHCAFRNHHTERSVISQQNNTICADASFAHDLEKVVGQCTKSTELTVQCLLGCCL